MNKCSPVEMRKNLQAVDMYRNAGIDFVPIPVSSLNCKNNLLSQGNEALKVLVGDAINDMSDSGISEQSTENNNG